jgi:probable rRNA maturation factor
LSVAVATPDGPFPGARGLGPWLSRFAPARARGEVTVAIVSDGRMRSLNRAYRGKNAATDVLSFPAEKNPGFAAEKAREKRHRVWFLGDIVIAGGVAARQADAAGHAVGTEIRILALHGLLHLLGYDHETDAGEMARVEARLRKKAGLGAAGLIERSR